MVVSLNRRTSVRTPKNHSPCYRSPKRSPRSWEPLVFLAKDLSGLGLLELQGNHIPICLCGPCELAIIPCLRPRSRV